jgi:hypothetical protein
MHFLRSIRLALLKRKFKRGSISFLTVYLASFNKPRIYHNENSQTKERCWRHS